MSLVQVVFGIFREHKTRTDDEKQIPLSEWAENMQNRQKLILKLAQAAQEATDDFHIVKASAKRTEFPINSYVLVKYRDRPPSKFHSQWKGPLRVVSYAKSNYVLQDLVTNKESTYHITQLKAFKYDEMETDPVDIARAEQQEFVVEAILDHSKVGEKRGDYKFRVKWPGYDEAKDTVSIGSHGRTAKARYCAVIDLTSGYWQAPLSKKSQSVSAFITFMGLFEWLRLPMGLKGTGSHFQQQVASRVLKGLIYKILELYLDDIIVYGRTKEEFIANLRQV
eukprot:gene29818-36932_t